MSPKTTLDLSSEVNEIIFQISKMQNFEVGAQLQMSPIMQADLCTSLYSFIEFQGLKTPKFLTYLCRFFILKTFPPTLNVYKNVSILIELWRVYCSSAFRTKT